MTTVYIKDMVCSCCIMLVKHALEKLGLRVHKVVLGQVVLHETSVSASQQELLDIVLKNLGFERISDAKGRLIQSIKNAVIERIHRRKFDASTVSWRKILEEVTDYDYNYLSNLFSSHQGITLEQYIIRQKVERVKELLLYDELSLSQIADEVGYNSLAHLSAQFKKVTGLTPSDLKKTKEIDLSRRPLDTVSYNYLT
jgi:AraC family transcriptional regulator